MPKQKAKVPTLANMPVIRAKTPEEAKKLLYAKGLTLRQFAAANNFSYRTVSEVVRGVNKGLYGEGHAVAVAFGLKKAA